MAQLSVLERYKAETLNVFLDCHLAGENGNCLRDCSRCGIQKRADKLKKIKKIIDSADVHGFLGVLSWADVDERES